MLFWFPNENGKFDVSAEGIPAKTTIKISYTDGYKKPTHYSDIFELNAVLLFGTAKPKTPVHRIQTDLQNRHQQQILKPHNPHTLPDSTARRVGVLSYSCHLTADPATKSDDNLTTHETKTKPPPASNSGGVTSAPGETRTHTGRVLNPLPLPIRLLGRKRNNNPKHPSHEISCSQPPPGRNVPTVRYTVAL